jgi:hypothetical protein
LVVGLALVIGGAELFFDGLLASAARWRLAPFVLTVVVSASSSRTSPPGSPPT